MIIFIFYPCVMLLYLMYYYLSSRMCDILYSILYLRGIYVFIFYLLLVYLCGICYYI